MTGAPATGAPDTPPRAVAVLLLQIPWRMPLLLCAKIEPPENGRAVDANVPAPVEPEATLAIGETLPWLEPLHP